MSLIDLFDTGMAKQNPKSSLNMQMQSYKFNHHTAGLGSQRTCTFPPVARQHSISWRKDELKVVDRRKKAADCSLKTPGSTGSSRSDIEQPISTLFDDVSDLDGKLGSISGRGKL